MTELLQINFIAGFTLAAFLFLVNSFLFCNALEDRNKESVKECLIVYLVCIPVFLLGLPVFIIICGTLIGMVTYQTISVLRS